MSCPRCFALQNAPDNAQYVRFVRLVGARFHPLCLLENQGFWQKSVTHPLFHAFSVA